MFGGTFAPPDLLAKVPPIAVVDLKAGAPLFAAAASTEVAVGAGPHPAVEAQPAMSAKNVVKSACGRRLRRRARDRVSPAGECGDGFERTIGSFSPHGRNLRWSGQSALSCFDLRLRMSGGRTPGVGTLRGFALSRLNDLVYLINLVNRITYLIYRTQKPDRCRLTEPPTDEDVLQSELRWRRIRLKLAARDRTPHARAPSLNSRSFGILPEHVNPRR